MIEIFIAISISFPILLFGLVGLFNMPATLRRQSDQINRVALLKVAIICSIWLDRREGGILDQVLTLPHS